MVAASRLAPARMAAALFPQSDLRRGRFGLSGSERYATCVKRCRSRGGGALHFESFRVQDRIRQQQQSFIDPNHEPIRVVDVASFHQPVGGKLDVTLCATVHHELNGDRTSMANVVTARLRLDLGMARALVEGLTRQIAMAEAAHSTRN